MAAMYRCMTPSLYKDKEKEDLDSWPDLIKIDAFKTVCDHFCQPTTTGKEPRFSRQKLEREWLFVRECVWRQRNDTKKEKIYDDEAGDDEDDSLSFDDDEEEDRRLHRASYQKKGTEGNRYTV